MAGLCRFRAAAPPQTLRRLGLLASRAYGSASAVQLHYDSDDDHDTEARWNRQPTAEESEGWVAGRGVQWVIMGDPLAKRHVYADRLSKLLDVPYISMGTLVRQELHPLSSLYKQIANAVNQGQLVPEDIIFGLLSKRLEDGYCRGETGFILDGIPRSRIQAEVLDQIADIDLVVNFKCTEPCLMKNQLDGAIYSPCKEFLGTGNSGLKLNLLSKDDQMNSSFSDAEGALKAQLCKYAEKSKPLEDYYRKQMKLLDFQVAAAPGETWQGLLAALHLQHMNAVSSSQKLTA